MGTIQSSKGWAVGSSTVRPRANRAKQAIQMKLSWKQRFRNWLNESNDENLTLSHDIEPARLESDGMRFNLYKASGGYVIETCHYDSKTDRHNNKMYVITDDKDVGEEMGKIITMESLR